MLHRGLRSRVEAAFALVRDQVRGIAVYVGYPEYQGDTIYNSAALVRDGQVLANHRKVALPNYAVFDEKRYFQPGDAATVVDLGGAQARTDHLRGRLGAGTVPRACGRRRRGHSRHQRLAVSPCAAASARAGACDAGAGKRAAADLRQHGRRPRRARVRRRLGRRRRQGAGAVPRAVVRGRPLHRGPRAHGRSARAACGCGNTRAAARRARLSRARARHSRLRREERLHGRGAGVVRRRRFGADVDDRRRRARPRARPRRHDAVALHVADEP